MLRLIIVLLRKVLGWVVSSASASFIAEAGRLRYPALWGDSCGSGIGGLLSVDGLLPGLGGEVGDLLSGLRSDWSD